MEKNTYKLSELIKQLQKEGQQTFLCGSAGTGKSYTINMIKSVMQSRAIVLSTTNMSAQHIGADTVHSFFRLKLSNNLDELKANDDDFIKWFCNNVTNNRNLATKSLYKDMREVLQRAELIIIDEVSMMSDKLLELIYYRLNKLNMMNDIPIPHILFVGDLFQLPPVDKDDKSAQMVFKSKHWNPLIIELTEIKRTENVEFAKALRHIQHGKYTRLVDTEINKILKNKRNLENETIICPTNKQVNTINHKKLQELDEPEIKFVAKIDTDLKNKIQIEKIINSFTADRELILKKGCEVIFVKTDKDTGYYNGLKGTVIDIDIDKNVIKVKSERGNEYQVKRVLFTKNKLVRNRITGGPELVPELTMKQFPLRVSYAITIHKSQGMSINNLVVNCKRIFGEAMFYVAISRATDPSKVFLANFDRSYVRQVNKETVNYYDRVADKIIRITEVENDTPQIQLDAEWEKMNSEIPF